MLIICGVFGAMILSGFNKTEKEETTHKKKIKSSLFGFDLNQFHFDDYPINSNMFLSDVLVYEGIPFKKIVQIENNSKDIFSTRNFKAGKQFTLVRPDECSSPVCMIYEPDDFSYVQYFFNDRGTIQQVEKSQEVCVETVSGVIEGSLWDAMTSRGLSPALIDKMEDALSSSVDFYHTQKGDKFYLIYEDLYVEGEKVGVGNVIGARYENERGNHFAVYYENDRYQGHYDLEGRPTKNAFLRAPVKYSRISSRFSYSRFHPIKKRRIPHLGTDYAAPKGTPIYSVADGVVEKASYARNNGKYVKIRHDNTYQTQYLHMNGFAKGIKRGTYVKQGQIIGYVGQTGLATGPHVCFRFWKNGKQINHLRENFPPADPLPQDEMSDYFTQRDITVDLLNEIPEPVNMKRSQAAFLAE